MLAADAPLLIAFFLTHPEESLHRHSRLSWRSRPITCFETCCRGGLIRRCLKSVCVYCLSGEWCHIRFDRSLGLSRELRASLSDQYRLEQLARSQDLGSLASKSPLIDSRFIFPTTCYRVWLLLGEPLLLVCTPPSIFLLIGITISMCCEDVFETSSEQPGRSKILASG